MGKERFCKRFFIKRGISVKVHHIGYMVKNIEAAQKHFQDLGYTSESDKVLDPIQQVYILFVKKDGYLVELIQPINKESRLNSLLKRQGCGPYHIAYEIEGEGTMEAAIKKLKKKGYIRVTEVEKALALNNREIVFLFNKDLGLIEIVGN